MRRSLTIFLVILLAVVGFAVGRYTGDMPASDVNEARKDFPVLPAPPKSGVFGASGEVAADADLILEVPADGAVLGVAFEVSGRAKNSREPLVIIVKDAAGTELYRTETRVESGEGVYGRFAAVVELAEIPVGDGAVEVFRRPAADATPADAVVRAVTFANPDTVKVKIFLGRTGFDEADACDTVYPVERLVSSKTQIYRAALSELIGGPTPAEKADGYFTSLPGRVTLKSVAADAAGTVTANFDPGLESGVAGSCRVIAIRAQIENTLRQFPEVRDVVLSVNGRADDVLQP